MKANAYLSPDLRYRYALWRQLELGLAAEHAGETCLFVMLNPSTADWNEDDPTIRRCIGFARGWGYGQLAVGNLFALRATDPDRLRDWHDPVGPENDHWLRSLAKTAGLIVAAWGAHPAADDRRRTDALRLLREGGVVHSLGVTAGGNPRHPLYLSGATQLVEFADFCGPVPRGGSV